MDSWAGRIGRVVRITCGWCGRDDEWSIEPVNIRTATRFFRNGGWRQLRDECWYCRICVPRALESLRMGGAVAMALSNPEEESRG